MSRTFRLILYFLIILLALILFCGSKNITMPVIILIIAIGIIIIKTIIEKLIGKDVEKDVELNDEIKLCKYCKSSIDIDASVCPVCKRGLTFNTNRGVLVLLLIIIFFLIWGVFSNNAPLFMRKTVCGLGIRNDFPYCYYIDIDK